MRSVTAAERCSAGQPRAAVPTRFKPGRYLVLADGQAPP